MLEIPDLTILENRFHQILGYRNSIKREISLLEEKLKSLNEEEETLKLVAELFRSLIDREIVQNVEVVEKLQTEGLRAVFADQDLQVKSYVEMQRGKVSVKLNVVQKSGDSLIEGSSGESFGGSILTVQSVILRIVVAIKNGLRPVFFFDESLPAFDSKYVVNMASFLRDLCSRLGLDMLLISHNPILLENSDHSYRLIKHQGHSTFVKEGVS